MSKCNRFSWFSYLQLALLVLLVMWPVPAQAHDPVEDPLDAVRFEQRLNTQIPLDLNFHNESGRMIHLGDYFGQKPVLLLFAYYECPNLCGLVLDGLTESLRRLAFEVGEQFEVVVLSIDPAETPEIAAARKETLLRTYGRSGTGGGWHFLTGEHEAIDRLAKAVGFHYAYDAAQDQYAHATGLLVLTPEGRISRYFYGIDFPARDLRLGLVEAADYQIGSAVDQVLLRCYRYDPETGRYSLAIMNILRLAGLVTVLGLGAGIYGLHAMRNEAG